MAQAPVPDGQLPPKAQVTSTIRSYTVLEPRGKGSFGEVYKLIYPETGQRYALKVFKDRTLNGLSGEGQVLKDRILDISAESLRVNEVKALKKANADLDSVKGRRIIEYVDDFYEENWKVHCLVLKPLCQRSFKEVILHEDYSLLQAIKYMCQVAEGLDYLHKNNIFHGDLTPRNILITDEDDIRLIDFGIASEINRVTGRPISNPISKISRSTAPELASKDTNRVDGPQADLWSLGVCGVVLFTQDKTMADDRDPNCKITYNQEYFSKVEKDVKSTSKTRAMERFRRSDDPTLVEARNKIIDEMFQVFEWLVCVTPKDRKPLYKVRNKLDKLYKDKIPLQEWLPELEEMLRSDDQGRLERAVEVCNALIDVIEDDDGDDSPKLISLYVVRGEAYLKLLNIKGARDDFNKAQELIDKREDYEPTIYAARCLAGRATVALRDNEFTNAQRDYEKASTLYSQSQDLRARCNLLLLRAELARTVRKFDDASQFLQQALELGTQDQQSGLELLPIKLELAKVQVDRLKYKEAYELYKEIEDTYREGVEKGHLEDVSLKAQIRIGQGQLAVTAQWSFDKAVALYEEALGIFKGNKPLNHAHIAQCYNLLGEAYGKKENWEKMAEAYDKAAEEGAYLAIHHEEKANTCHGYGTLYYNLGKEYYRAALDAYKDTAKAREKLYGKGHPLVSNSYSNIGIIYSNMKKFKEAVEEFKKSLKMKQDSLDPDDPSIFITIQNLGMCYLDNNQPDEAMKLFDQALEARRTSSSAWGKNDAIILTNKGNVLSHQKEYSKALECFDTALRYLREAELKPHHSLIVRALNARGKCLKLSGDEGGGEKVLQEAKELENQAKQELEAARTRHNSRKRGRDSSDEEEEKKEEDAKRPVIERGLSTPPPIGKYHARFDDN